MRLWTVHPGYLDAQGLVALWREGLLAQKVLQGHTRGYRHHPQLQRFRAQPDPLAAIATYLREIHAEGLRRGYRLDPTKIACPGATATLVESEGQLRYEWRLLLGRLRTRSPQVYQRHADIMDPQPHPLFRIVPGPVAGWERAGPLPGRDPWA